MTLALGLFSLVSAKQIHQDLREDVTGESQCSQQKEAQTLEQETQEII